jgi:hypothetical protein
MKTTISLIGLVAAMTLGGASATMASSSSDFCTNESVMSGFQMLDSEAVKSATRVNVLESIGCSGFASSTRYNPQLVSDINGNQAYHTALRRSGYPETDIYGATLAGDVLTVYIHS